MKKIKESIRKYFPFYILWMIISFVAVFWGYSILTAPKENEKLDVFICDNVINQSNISSFLQENKPEYLKEINCRISYKESEFFYSLLSTYGEVEVDLYLFPQEVLDEITPSVYFYAFDKEKAENLFGDNLDYYIGEDEKYYGIKIDSSVFVSDEMYVLFANDSLHLGDFTDSPYDGAIKIAKLLIEGKL